jgi:MarR family transcriptional regulator for hemolysin
MKSDGEKFGVLLLEIQRSFRSVMDRRLKPLGLSQAKWRALLQISKSNGELTQTELALLIGVETPSLARLLDRLERDEWIKRHDSPSDRRAKIIKLAKKSNGVMKIIEKAAREARDELFSNITRGEMGHLVNILEKMKAKAEKMQRNAA